MTNKSQRQWKRVHPCIHKTERARSPLKRDRLPLTSGIWAKSSRANLPAEIGMGFPKTRFSAGCQKSKWATHQTCTTGDHHKETKARSREIETRAIGRRQEKIKLF